MRRRRGAVTFCFLLLAAEIAGRSLTGSVDRALHVAPLARTDTSYYPFLLLGVKVAGALLLAGLAARVVRARAAAAAGERLLGRRDGTPRLRPGLSPRVWCAAFAGTTALYLVHGAAIGSASFTPLVHSYALPVFAVLSVFVAVAWRFARWVHAIEDYARGALARARRVISAGLPVRAAHPRPSDESGLRRRFGVVLDSRPPPLPA